MMKKAMAQIKMRETYFLFVDSFIKASGRMWTMASPIRAPQASAYSIFTKILKHPYVKHFCRAISNRAATKPIRERPNPVRKPKPQLSEVVRVASALATTTRVRVVITF
jgi:hypothetical protein